MIGRSEASDGTLRIGGIPANALAERHGTPIYVLDAAAVFERLARLRHAVSHPRVQIYYSVKANPSVGLLRRLRAAGVKLDACSPGDLAFARAAGFTTSEISYTGHSMTDAEIDAVAGSGAMFTVDSLSQLERIGKINPGRAVGLRLNCGIAAGFHPHVQAGATNSKFGIHLSQLSDALELTHRHELHIVGLHSHLGSDIADCDSHLELLDILLGAASIFPDLAWVNLGGGWGEHDGAAYDLEAFGRGVDKRLAAGEALLGRPLELRLEPGGYMVIASGWLLTRVTELKPSVTLKGQATPSFVCVDASHNHLVSAVIYGTRHPVWPANLVGDRPKGRYDLTGHLMQAGDLLAQGIVLPEPRPGEVLVIGGCGGYAAWRASCFNERPRAAEVIVEDGVSLLLRRAETDDDLLALEEPVT